MRIVLPLVSCANTKVHTPAFALRLNPVPMVCPTSSTRARPSQSFTSAGIHVLYSFLSPRDPARNDRAMTQVPSWVEPFRLQISHQMVSISLKIHPATLISYNIVTSINSRVEEVKVARVPDHQEPFEVARKLDHLAPNLFAMQSHE